MLWSGRAAASEPKEKRDGSVATNRSQLRLERWVSTFDNSDDGGGERRIGGGG